MIQTGQTSIYRGGGRSGEVRWFSQPLAGPIRKPNWALYSVLCSARLMAHISIQHASGLSCLPQAAVSRVSFHQSDHQPHSPGQRCTYAGEMSALYSSNSQPSTHTKSTIKNIKLFPSLNPKCHETNCISAIYLKISLGLIASTPECFSIRSG